MVGIVPRSRGVVGGNAYGVSGTMFSSVPVVTAPAKGATWQATTANEISWSGGAPTDGEAYQALILDSAGNEVFPVSYLPGLDLPITTTSESIPAGTLSPGIYFVAVGISTSGLLNSAEGGGVPIPNAVDGSGLWLGNFAGRVPISVQ